ncbi:hypothetical protein ACS5PK_01470 [Roseateles sp. DB2]|uniref:hypothetical protein n=1 Tax=Roseateles sp. DB2 TaxID=3453717 RepID=UPI003EE9E11E
MNTPKQPRRSAQTEETSPAADASEDPREQAVKPDPHADPAAEGPPQELSDEENA